MYNSYRRMVANRIETAKNDDAAVQRIFETAMAPLAALIPTMPTSTQPEIDAVVNVALAAVRIGYEAVAAAGFVPEKYGIKLPVVVDGDRVA